MTRVIVSLLLLAVASPAVAEAPRVLVPKTPAKIEPTERQSVQVRKAYARASKAFQRGRMKTALKYAKKAWETVPSAGTAMLLGMVFGEVDDPCAAVEQSVIALDLGPTTEQRTLIIKTLTTQGPLCGQGMGWATLDVDPEGAEVRIGGVAVAGHRAVTLARGLHQVEVKAEGYETKSEQVQVIAGAGLSLRYSLSKKVVVQPDPPDPRDPRDPRDPGDPKDPKDGTGEPKDPRDPLDPKGGVTKRGGESSDAGWWLVGGGGALAAGGAVFIALTFDALDESEQLSQPSTGLSEAERQQRFQDAVDRGKLYQTTGWILGGAGLALMATGAVLLATERGGEADRGGVQVAPLVTPEVVGLGVAGRL